MSEAVMQCICKPGTGLFPAPREIKLGCSCPDWAGMCKHVAAVLYGVGARLDQQPELLFQLRRVDAKDLVASAGAGLRKTGKGPVAGKVLADAQLADVFGIEIDDEALTGSGAARTRRKVPVKAAAPAKAAPAAKTSAVAKRGAAAKAGPAKAASPGKAPAAKPKATAGKKAPARAKSSPAKTGPSTKKKPPASRRG